MLALALQHITKANPENWLSFVSLNGPLNQISRFRQVAPLTMN